MMQVKDIIRRARGKLTQQAFSKTLGKSQAVLSKYETGAASPPAEVLDYCLKKIQRQTKGDISVSMLVDRLKKDLSGPDYAYARKVVNDLLDGLQHKKSPT